MQIIYGSFITLLAILCFVAAITVGIPWWAGLLAYCLIMVELVLTGTEHILTGIHEKTEVPHD